MKTLIQFFLLCCLPLYLFAITDQQVQAVKLTFPVIIDGRLTEPVWASAKPVAPLVQREPNQGDAPSEKTEIWVAYDDDALYVAARLYDSQPDSIMQVLGRRDNIVTSDWFAVFIDGYHDKRSGNFFFVGPSGAVGDGVLYNDDWNDVDWDGVWEGKTSIDETGWTVEMRIPFSQIRFHENANQVWGINFERDIGRKNETDFLRYTPKNESGYVSRFVDLVGIEGIKPSAQAEILPFVTTKAEYTHPAAGNPFNDGSRYGTEVGADLRYGLSSNLILNATVNPDFGQVEVDPAEVNLSDVESFFQEKRPFFVEGANIFTNFGHGGGRNYWNANFNTPTLFYSRRIGRSPHGNDTLNNVEYLNMPVATQIIGAGKITGKLGDEWNVGTIHAVTAREYAPFQVNGSHSEAEVEPTTYYGVARMQRDFDQGRQGLGFLTTVTTRNFSNTGIGSNLKNNLNRDGIFTGVDGWTFLDDEKAWVISGWSGLSYVGGTSDRMIQVQNNSQHYFQRPDAKYVSVDSTATSLQGYAGRVYLIKQKGNFFFNSAVGFIDPKFDVNDLGYLSRADVMNGHIGAGYNWPDPDGFFRRKELGGLIFQSLDFGGNIIGRGFYHFGFVQFMNFYSIDWGFGAGTETINQRRTRGGPMTLNAPYIEYNISLNSDGSKNLSAQLSANGNSSSQSRNIFSELSVSYRPVPQMTFSIDPFYEFAFNGFQYLTAVDDPTAAETFGKRYLFGELQQRTFGAGIRLNWTFTPVLSLQLYVQPFISSGSYDQFKELEQPRSNNYMVYGTNNSVISKSGTEYTVDPHPGVSGGPISFDDPNFNYKSLRGNAVLRWEYLPGSALYFVWTQSRSDEEQVGTMRFNHSLRRLIDTRADNIFLMKMSYYFNM